MAPRLFLRSHRPSIQSTGEPRAYTIAQICEKLPMAQSTFFELRKRNALPFLEAMPPLGRLVRYRADLVDAWLANGRRELRAVEKVSA